MTAALTGFMGSGKSCTGRAVAERLGWDFLDLDEYVVRKEGRSIPEIFDEGEEVFRAMELAAVQEIISAYADRNLVLALGGGTMETPDAASAVLDGTVCIYLEASSEYLSGWLEGTEGSRPMLQRTDWRTLLERRRAGYERAHYTVDATQEWEELLKNIISLLEP